jgi:hypothetical protein
MGEILFIVVRCQITCLLTHWFLVELLIPIGLLFSFNIVF